jgi:hypothetical protein
MGPRGFWIALAIVLAIVLFYLIARPHVAKVWHVVSDAVAVGTPTTRFPDSAECSAAATRLNESTDTTGAYCASGTALLWGW